MRANSGRQRETKEVEGGQGGKRRRRRKRKSLDFPLSALLHSVLPSSTPHNTPVESESEQARCNENYQLLRTVLPHLSPLSALPYNTDPPREHRERLDERPLDLLCLPHRVCRESRGGDRFRLYGERRHVNGRCREWRWKGRWKRRRWRRRRDGQRVIEKKDEEETKKKEGIRSLVSFFSFRKPRSLTALPPQILVLLESNEGKERRTDCPRRVPVSRLSRSIMRSSQVSRVCLVGYTRRTNNQLTRLIAEGSE